MMELRIDEGWAERAAAAFQRAPIAAHEHMTQALGNINKGFLTIHAQRRLSRGGKKVGQVGLVSRTGSLLNSRQEEVLGDTLDDLRSFTFISAPANRYAKIHELGTVGAGGTEPDIVPKSAKVLRFEVEGKVVYATRVKIPPRLGWFSVWDRLDNFRATQLGLALGRIAADIGDDVAS